jgi:hypothetical protein
MSSRHAEHPGEYSRLACAAKPGLLASPVASQFQAANASTDLHLSLTSMPGGTVAGVTGRRHFYAQSVDICVEAREVTVPDAPTPHRESADNNRFLLRASGSSADAQRAAEYE